MSETEEDLRKTLVCVRRESDIFQWILSHQFMDREIKCITCMIKKIEEIDRDAYLNVSGYFKEYFGLTRQFGGSVIRCVLKYLIEGVGGYGLLYENLIFDFINVGQYRFKIDDSDIIARILVIMSANWDNIDRLVKHVIMRCDKELIVHLCKKIKTIRFATTCKAIVENGADWGKEKMYAAYYVALYNNVIPDAFPLAHTSGDIMELLLLKFPLAKQGALSQLSRNEWEHVVKGINNPPVAQEIWKHINSFEPHILGANVWSILFVIIIALFMLVTCAILSRALSMGTR